MRFKWNKNYLGWGITAFAVVAASSVLIYFIFFGSSAASGIGNLIGAIQPIFYGFIFAYLLSPIVSFFERKVFNRVFKPKKVAQTAQSGVTPFIKNKPARVASIVTAVLIFLVIIAAVISAIVPQLYTTITLLVNNIPSYITNTTEWVQSTFASFPELGEEMMTVVSEAGSALKNFLSNSILPQMGDYLGFVTNGIMSVVGAVLNIFLGIVVAIYCLYSKELFSAQAKKLIYSMMKVGHANSFIGSVRKIRRSFGQFITGTLIDSFIVGCITFIVTTICGIPFSLLVSVIMGITNIIPYFGPFIGAVPSAFLILMEDPFKCLIFIIIVLVIQNLNGNVLSPRILGESMGLSGFWVVFAILAGQGIFGFWGMIIGIPLFAVIYSAARSFISSRLDKKGLPAGSDVYTDVKCIDPETLSPVSLSKANAGEQRERELFEKQRQEEKRRERQEKAEALRSKFTHGKKNKGG